MAGLLKTSPTPARMEDVLPPRPLRPRTGPEVRAQIEVWIGREEAAMDAIRAEYAQKPDDTEIRRRLARTDGSLATLRTVLRYANGEWR
ncbi:MAG: hypothetical protein ACOYB2_10765 [Limnohabitans sp.]